MYLYVGPRLVLLQTSPASLTHPRVYFHVRVMGSKPRRFSDNGQEHATFAEPKYGVE